jgi:hypothetical protein
MLLYDRMEIPFTEIGRELEAASWRSAIFRILLDIANDRD